MNGTNAGSGSSVLDVRIGGYGSVANTFGGANDNDVCFAENDGSGCQTL
jgi:hypothetical protein